MAGDLRQEQGIAELVYAAREGDRRCWDALVERLTPLIWRIARAHRLSDADAADVTQNTWMRFVEHLDRLEVPAAAPGWLATTARHECLAVIRRTNRQRPTAPEDLPEAVVDEPVDTQLLAAERRLALLGAFDQLGKRCKDLIRLWAGGASYAEISRKLELPHGSIGPTLGRCADRLRDLLSVSESLFGDSLSES